MKMALRESGIKPGEVAHINAHATSTPQGDVAEALAIKNALGEDAASHLVLTSNKTGAANADALNAV